MKLRSNREMLFAFLWKDPLFAHRRKPEAEYPPTTAHMQSMANLAAQEFQALSEGSAECETHAGYVDNACPYCGGIW